MTRPRSYRDEGSFAGQWGGAVEDHEVDPFAAGQLVQVIEEPEGVLGAAAGSKPDRNVQIPRIGVWVEDASEHNHQVQILTVAERCEGAMRRSFAQVRVLGTHRLVHVNQPNPARSAGS